tara:strand:- start:12608 stop:12982 length:375 start_codon:yes stop_codon:yes gene_type:complete
MKILNFQNIEKLIFHNDNIRHHLPQELQNHIYAWQMGRKASFLRQTAKKAVFDFLNALNDEHLDMLSEFFGEPVRVEKIDYKSVKSLKLPLSKTNICEALCEMVGHNYFTTWRDSKYLYISLWK